MEKAIEVIDLTKTFGDFTAVKGISFDVKKGEVFGFLGPNGSGKTTVIRMILGLVTPTSGKGVVLGHDVATDSYQLRHKIGYMSQKFSLYEELTVEENLEFYAGVYNLSRAKIREKKAQILEMADLVGKEHMVVANLSGGWKQRLALGCSIIHDPQILLLDEPTGGVDPIARRHFWDIIYDLSKSGVTILVTTHYMDEAEHCNTIGFLYYGEILSVDTPRNLKASTIDGEILELTTGDPLATIDALTKLQGVESAAVHGAGVHALVAEGTEPERIRRELAASDINVHRLTRVKPSLEDVFVFLVERERRKQAQEKQHDL